MKTDFWAISKKEETYFLLSDQNEGIERVAMIWTVILSLRVGGDRDAEIVFSGSDR